jgi:lipopolysaccharide biosynthesis glycosyltransferase
MSSDDFVEVALAADKNYIIGLTVAACSIAKSCSPAANLRFHILYSDFTKKNKANIKQKLLSSKSNCEVCFYDVSDIDFSFFPLYASSRMAYARLALPHLLTKTEFVIYTDVDTLWLDDISELWQLKDEIPLISCPREQAQKTIDMEVKWFSARNLQFNRANYFCTGISFYNLSAIRETGVFDKVLEFGKRFENFNCADQSMLYGAIGDKVKLLPDRWQTFPRNGIPDSSGKNVVLHYAGEAPWKVTSCTHLITDTQLLWFDACSLVFNESLWRSLRRFYSPFTIIKARLLFVALFKIWPTAIFGKILLKCSGIKNFKESLKNRKRYLEGFAVDGSGE